MLTNETEAFWEKHVSVTLCPPQIPYGFAGDESVPPPWQNTTYAILTNMYDYYVIYRALQVQVPTFFFAALRSVFIPSSRF